MSKSEMLHEFYIKCKELSFMDYGELSDNAQSEEEREFIRAVTDIILQQKQRKVIAEKRF